MEKPEDKSQKSQAQTAAKEISADKAAEIAAQNAEANAGIETVKSPEETAKAEATANGETEETRIARAIAAIRKDNPDMSIDDIATLVTKVFAKTETIEVKVIKEASTIIDTTPNPFKEKVYLKKDKDRQFPLEKEALNGVVVRQTYKKETEEGDKITVPARNLNEIAIYSQEDFDRLNHGDPKKPGFAREGVSVEVWHKPGQSDSVAE